MSRKINNHWMKLALYEARKAYALDEVPVGCVIVKDGKMISKSHNLMKSSKNQTNHAEKLAIDAASNALGDGYLNGCDMYVTLEPCNMCAAAISFVRIRRVYIGALDEKGGAIYHNGKIYYNKGLHHIPDHYQGFSEAQCSQLIIDFFKKKREFVNNQYVWK